MNPHTVVDKYDELGYDILAITDHNEVTYPWTHFSDMKPSESAFKRKKNSPEVMPENFDYQDRNPEMLGFIDIQGNELSRHHHTGSFFSNYMGSLSEEESLDSVTAKNGIAILFHPGRYKYPVQWYSNLYSEYDHLVGQEVFNQGDKYPVCRPMWDSLLTVTMPEKPIWGFSNDDMHTIDQLGRNWNLFVLPERTQEWVRKGMTEGRLFFVYAPNGHDGTPPPKVESVKVNNLKKTIKINAVGQDSVLWISVGKVVSKGNVFNLKNTAFVEKYVRAEIYGQNGIIVGTQPFGIVKDEKRTD
jgi:hypothetical protein